MKRSGRAGKKLILPVRRKRRLRGGAVETRRQRAISNATYKALRDMADAGFNDPEDTFALIDSTTAAPGALTDEGRNIVGNNGHLAPGDVLRVTSTPNTNFFIFPYAAIEGLATYKVFTIENEAGNDVYYLNLAPLYVVVHDIVDSWGGVYDWTINTAIHSNPQLLFQNAIEILTNCDPDDEDYLPHLDGDTLIIPTGNIFDLPEFIFCYIIWWLANFYNANGMGNNNCFLLEYSTGGNTYTVAKGDPGRNIGISNGRISFSSVMELYKDIMKKFAGLLPTGGQEVSWTGSEESGTVIRIQDNAAADYNLTLDAHVVNCQSIAGCWTPAVEKLISEQIGNCVVSVRNKNDNKCLIYCLILALITQVKEKSTRIFRVTNNMIDDFEIYSKGMFMFTDSDEVSKLIRKLARSLMPAEYSDGEIEKDEFLEFVKEIDKKAGTMMSVDEFRDVFSDMERKLVDKKICGIDVYGIDYGKSKHIYPLYVSKEREKIVSLLCVTIKGDTASHYCLILDMEKLFRGTGGKQFFSCSFCGRTFYHRCLLGNHVCEAKKLDYQVPGEGGYHFSEKDAKDSCDIIVGACSKCRLCFISDFKYEYHKQHCFMKGKTGYRHIHLLTYEDHERAELCGEAINQQEEDEHVKNRSVLFSDFESSINPETGLHTFMSYGIYDWENDVYDEGTSLDDFFTYVLNRAFNNPQEHVYVYFHNAMNYDGNFILRHVLKTPEFANWGIQVIMKSSNRLQKLVFHIKQGKKRRHIHIADTFLFLTLSLEKIVGSIRKDDIEMNKVNFERFFRVFRYRYPGVSDESLDHILRKNIFPYKYFTDASKLETDIEEFVTIFEPKKENLVYFSERVTLEDLENGLGDTIQVMETFKCKTAKDYHDLYLCCDVMQLADVFMRSMNILWESHHIHLTKYLGMPSASWAAFLRHDPSMRIPLYEDTFYAEFFQHMLRGGLTSAALRHAVAGEDGDAFYSIIYLDVNGLYPYVMQKYLYPCGNFRFIPMGYTGYMAKTQLETLFEKFERTRTGMCFCVDLHIPDSVKELTDMYPFAPEHRRIYKEYFQDFEKQELSPFLQRWSEANGGEKMKEFNGLVCTLYDKEKYNVHWRLLKFYMEHGVEVRKVWYAVSFDEGDYLAGYIRKNIEIRNGRKDELGKTLYKLLGNSIYGKTFESPLKRHTYEIIRDPLKLRGLIEEGSVAAYIPIDDLGWIVKMDGEDIVLDKPTYIGACVCEFSKLHMYTLLYDKLMKIFPDRDDLRGCQLVYTDTDSFILKVLHPPEIGHDPHSLFSYIKEKDPELIGGIGGQVKSETGEDATISEVIALRSKVYAYRTTDGHIGKRAKGTTYDAQEMQLNWDIYKKALETLTSIDTENVQFVRSVFKVSSVSMLRRSLSVNDGKRFICEDGIHTHAFGYPNPDEEFRLCRQAERRKYETLDDDDDEEGEEMI